MIQVIYVIITNVYNQANQSNQKNHSSDKMLPVAPRKKRLTKSSFRSPI